jgi:hypothetical protein
VDIRAECCTLSKGSLRVMTLGFVLAGAQLLPVSHCFAVNGNSAQPEVEGIQGILEGAVCEEWEKRK